MKAGYYTNKKYYIHWWTSCKTQHTANNQTTGHTCANNHKIATKYWCRDWSQSSSWVNREPRRSMHSRAMQKTKEIMG